MRLFLRLLAFAILALPLPSMAAVERIGVNVTAFPLSGNVMFPSRTKRVALRCQNSLSNNAATIVYPSGFSIVLQPGGALWDAAPTDRYLATGAIQATGTSGQTLSCEETYERYE